MPNKDEWHDYCRRKGAQAVVFTRELERSPWGAGPGVWVSLVDFHDAARAAGVADVPLPPHLSAVVTAHVDGVLAAMGAPPLCERDITEAGAEVLP